jgi:hypothetical protein
LDLTEVRNFEQQKVMKLSEAIRIGAKRIPANDGHWYFDDNGACLLGTVDCAVFGHTHYVPGVHMRLDKYFGLDSREGPMNTAHVMFINGKSREQIADWLESQGL